MFKRPYYPHVLADNLDRGFSNSVAQSGGPASFTVIAILIVRTASGTFISFNIAIRE